MYRFVDVCIRSAARGIVVEGSDAASILIRATKNPTWIFFYLRKPGPLSSSFISRETRRIPRTVFHPLPSFFLVPLGTLILVQETIRFIPKRRTNNSLRLYAKAAARHKETRQREMRRPFPSILQFESLFSPPYFHSRFECLRFLAKVTDFRDNVSKRKQGNSMSISRIPVISVLLNPV